MFALTFFINAELKLRNALSYHTVDHGGKILIKFINTKLHKIGHLFHVITEKFHACKTPVVVEIDLPRSASVNTASVIANINNTELKNLA